MFSYLKSIYLSIYLCYFYCCLQVMWKIKTWKTWKVTSLSHTVYASHPKINAMASSFSTFKMPACGAPTAQYRLAWKQATSNYLDISLQENSLQGELSLSSLLPKFSSTIIYSSSAPYSVL